MAPPAGGRPSPVSPCALEQWRDCTAFLESLAQWEDGNMDVGVRLATLGAPTQVPQFP
jgi:hypothetical protein